MAKELECWRCGAEGDKFKEPAHPDGGGDICDACHSRMFGLSPMRRESQVANDNYWDWVAEGDEEKVAARDRDAERRAYEQ